MTRLAGRRAVITGASRGIGAATAVRFAAEGARLLLVARTEAELRAVAECCNSAAGTGSAAATLPADLAVAGAAERVVESVERRFGALDILVGNAGVLGGLSPVARVERAAWEHVLAVNATANLDLMRLLDPALRRSPSARMIFVTSGLSRRPFAGWAKYAASKGALESLVLAHAAEVADTPVRANLLDPGQVATALHRAAFPDRDPATLKPPKAVADAFVALAEPACHRHGEILKASEIARWCDWSA